MAELKREEFFSKHQIVVRFYQVDEVTKPDGKIVYHVQVWDEGRKPFLSKWWNDPTPAMDFVESLMNGGPY